MTLLSRKTFDLGGTWQIAFDPEGQPLQKEWIEGNWPEKLSQPVQVPGIWNIPYPQAEGVGYYRKTFSIPDSWNGDPFLLHFEGVTYRCEVWFNGSFVGSHEGGFTPFWFDVGKFIRKDQQNVLLIRVAALSKTKKVDGMLLKHVPLSKQSWHYTYGGIWGKVFLESCPVVACQKLTVIPNLQSENANLEITVNNRLAQVEQIGVNFQVIDPRGEVVIDQIGTVPAPPGVSNFSYILNIPRPLAWSCEQPNLYRVEALVSDQKGGKDHQSVNFGMRDFTVQNGQFFLNGEPIFIRGVLLQPNYPVTLVTHPDEEMMLREISLVKEAGFNLIRTHLHPASAGFLDLCDELGMLVYAESCLAWIRHSPRLWDHGQREIRAMIERDRNHPSIVFWGIYNENPRASAINSKALVRLARSLDPTRVIVDNSGGSLAIDQDFGWIDRATFTPAWESQPQRIMDVHLYLGAPISSGINNWLRNLGTGVTSHILVEEGIGSTAVIEEFDRENRTYQGKIFVSEIGYGGLSELDETSAHFGDREELLDARELKALRNSMHAGFKKRKLENVFGTVHNLYLEAQEVQAIGNSQQIAALYCNPRVSGYVIAFNDCAWECHAGMVDLWRNPKPAYYAAQRANQPQILVLNPEKINADVGETVRIDMTLVNHLPMKENGLLSISIEDEQGNTILQMARELLMRKGIQPLENLLIEMKTAGNYRINARLTLNDEVLAEVSETINGFEKIDWRGLRQKITPIGQIPRPINQTGIFQGETDPLAALVPMASTVSMEEWDMLFKSVHAGGCAVIGALRPEDQSVLDRFNDQGIPLELHPGVGSWMGCYHWIPKSDIFSGLPAGGLAKLSYAEVLPKYVMCEMGGETLAGSFNNTKFEIENPSILWYSDIEIVSYGKGHFLFCQYRIFDQMDHDPIAAKMTHNLLHLITSKGSL